jgi:hypothetical protein
MVKQRKTRRELIKMIADRLRPAQVHVASIHRDMEGAWAAIVVGSPATIDAVQPRIDAIVAELRQACELIPGDAEPSGSARAQRMRSWLNWVRRRRPGVTRYE